MPPRRRQPAGAAAQPGSEAPRRSERLRRIREANSTPANSTPPNLPIARASRTITNAPRRRRRDLRLQALQEVTREAAEAVEAAQNALSIRRRGLQEAVQAMLRTAMSYLPGFSPDIPDTTGAIRAPTPNLVTPAGPEAGFLGPPTEDRRQQVVRRLTRELQKFMQDPVEGCHVEVVNDNLFNWRATISGPADTPYEGGEFHLDVKFGPNYPFSPPRLYFLTKIYHCNIGATGCICLDILTTKWSPALGVAKVLLSIQSLLADPNPDDPLEPEIATQYKRQREQHDKTAREWTTQYAKPQQANPERELPESN